MAGKGEAELLERLEFRFVALAEETDRRLKLLERRLELENYALTGLRWVAAVAGGAVIIALVNGWLS